MSIYNGLRCKVIIKEEYREELDYILKDSGEWCNSTKFIFKRFSQVNKSECIPFAPLSYMPDEWEDYDLGVVKDGFYKAFNKGNGFLVFQCSFKDVDGAISYFIKNVLNDIVEKSYHIESICEEDSVSKLYVIEEGVAKELNYGIKYEGYGSNEKGVENSIKYSDYNFNVSELECYYSKITEYGY